MFILGPNDSDFSDRRPRAKDHRHYRMQHRFRLPRSSSLRAAAADEGIDVRVLEMDVTSDTSVNAAAETVLSESGAPDAVIT